MLKVILITLPKNILKAINNSNELYLYSPDNISSKNVINILKKNIINERKIRNIGNFEFRAVDLKLILLKIRIRELFNKIGHFSWMILDHCWLES